MTLADTRVEFRKPVAADGAAIWRLVKESGVLDLNSPYAYFLLGEHFAETCIVAENETAIVGFVSAYIPSNDLDTLFVWQVGIAASMRKQGLALKMIRALLQREACNGIDSIRTTITPSNQASRALFAALARDIGAEIEEQKNHFPAEWFPQHGHEAESLFVISPVQHA